MPIVPLWMIDGDIWKLHFGFQRDWDRIEIHGPTKSWCTSDPESTIRLLSTVRAVMEWGSNDYLPWFLEAINYPGR